MSMSGVRIEVEEIEARLNRAVISQEGRQENPIKRRQELTEVDFVQTGPFENIGDLIMAFKSADMGSVLISRVGILPFCGPCPEETHQMYTLLVKAAQDSFVSYAPDGSTGDLHQGKFYLTPEEAIGDCNGVMTRPDPPEELTRGCVNYIASVIRHERNRCVAATGATYLLGLTNQFGLAVKQKFGGEDSQAFMNDALKGELRDQEVHIFPFPRNASDIPSLTEVESS